MTIWIAVIIAAVLGLLAGAIVNICLLRTKEGLEFMLGRRKCTRCAMPAAALDHVPLLSYFNLKGKCRSCSAVIPWQYPLTEIAFALLFAGFMYQALTGYGVPDFVSSYPLYGEPLAFFMRNAVVSMLLVPIFIFDYRASVIPDRLSIPAVVIALLMNIVLGASVPMLLVSGLLIGSFFAIQFLVSRGRWVGGGDIRVGLLMGFLLGLELGVVALLLSYILGSIIGVWLLATKRRKLQSHVPFGTFMAVAIFAAIFWGECIYTWYIGLLP